MILSSFFVASTAATKFGWKIQKGKKARVDPRERRKERKYRRKLQSLRLKLLKKRKMLYNVKQGSRHKVCGWRTKVPLTRWMMPRLSPIGSPVFSPKRNGEKRRHEEATKGSVLSKCWAKVSMKRGPILLYCSADWEKAANTHRIGHSLGNNRQSDCSTVLMIFIHACVTKCPWQNWRIDGLSGFILSAIT